MSTTKKCKVNFVDFQPPRAFPSVKEVRKLMKEESEVLKHWPRDALLEWNDDFFLCEQCGTLTSTLSNLTRHKQLHDKEILATSQCPHCFKHFFRKDNMIRHARNHCPIKKHIDAPSQPTHPLIVDAANSVLAMATQSKKRKTAEWALKPINLYPALPKAKRNPRKPKKQTLEIPLNSTQKLLDPRVPTPITDEDVLLVEQMLDEPTPSTSTQSSVTNIPVTQEKQSELTNAGDISIDDPEWVNKIDQRTISEDDDDWLSRLIDRIDEVNAYPNNLKEDENTTDIEDMNTDADIEKPEEPIEPKSTSDIKLVLNLSLPQPHPRDIGVSDFARSEVEAGRIIPPWESDDNIKQVMGTIWHNYEQYIVLDEL